MNRLRESTLSYEDPLAYLPRKPVQEFAKRRVIYDAQQPSDHLYVVILGCVKITKISEAGSQMVTRIVSQEGLFGEAALIGAGSQTEDALALDNVTLIS